LNTIKNAEKQTEILLIFIIDTIHKELQINLKLY